ncbi:MAG: hypothetical protein IJE48_06405 [Clostridia bacterium]|nr:hypothetical protein [Clostridia bacterium]
MKNTIKKTSIDLANNLTIDHANKTITVSKQFHKASGKYGTEEYLVLEDLMSKFSDYRVVVRTQSRRNSNRISFEIMAKYIAKHDSNGEIMNEFLVKRGLKVDKDNKTSAESFHDIKTWFYEQYPELKKINDAA